MNRKKVVVYLNDEAAFALYGSELSRYGIAGQHVISGEEREQLLWKVLFPRAKERALNLIAVSPKTAREIGERLRQGYYPEEICEETIRFLKEYGYVNDWEYAKAYVTSKRKRVSLRKIAMELVGKGIDRELIQGVLAEEEPDETAAIRRFAEKMVRGATGLDERNRRRVYRALLYRGYSRQQISKVLENYAGNG